MPITFQEQIKRQRNLINVFIVLALITIVIIWQGYFSKKEVPERLILRRFKGIEVDFEALAHPLLDELELTEEIPAFEGEIGRENPFSPAF